VATVIPPASYLDKRKSAGKRDKAACLRPISGLSSPNLYCYRASPGVATRHAEVRALRAWREHSCWPRSHSCERNRISILKFLCRQPTRLMSLEL